MAMRAPSIGGSYELQGKPEMYENIAMEQLRYKEQKKAAKKKEAEDAMNKYKNALKVDGYDPAFNEEVMLAVAPVFSVLDKNRDKLNTIESNPEYRMAMANAQQKLGNYKYLTERIKQDELLWSAHPDKFQMNEDNNLAWQEARSAGRLTDKAKSLMGEGGKGYVGNLFSTPKGEERSFNELTVKTLSPFTEAKAKKGGGWYFDESQGVMVNTDTATFDLPSAETLLDSYLKEPGWAKQAVKEFNSLPEEERSKYSDPKDYIKKTYAPRLVVEDTKSRGSKSGGDGVSVTVVQDALNTPTKTIEASKSGAFSNEGLVYGQIAVPSGLTPSALTVNAGAIDEDTGMPISKAITDKDFKLGSPVVVPIVTKDGRLGKRGQRVTQSMLDKWAVTYPEQDITKEFEFKAKAYIPTTITEKVEDKDGNMVERERQKQYLDDLQPHKGGYGKKVASIDDYFKKAEELNKDKKAALKQVPTARREDWIKNGWTEQAIEEAKAAGKIRVIE